MSNGKYQFGVGLAVGIVLAALFFLYFAPRYKTMQSGGMLYKQDLWSGDTWRHVDNEWKKVMRHDRDWGKIDEALRQALNIPERKNERAKALEHLRKKYADLGDISDEDLLERIKIVYAKEIMNDLYLSDFVKIHGKAEK
jgi:hypothetical protein